MRLERGGPATSSDLARGARTEQITAALRDGFGDAELGQLTAAALFERLAEKL